MSTPPDTLKVVTQAPPTLSPPVYVSLAIPDDLAKRLAVVGKHPVAGLVAATLLGATASYFLPQFFDWATGKRRAEFDDED